MIWVVILLFVIPLICLTIYFALSSCLGDGLRRQNSSLPLPTFGRTYLSSISSGAWENIEMSGIRQDSDSELSEYSDEGEGVFQQ